MANTAGFNGKLPEQACKNMLGLECVARARLHILAAICPIKRRPRLDCQGMMKEGLPVMLQTTAPPQAVRRMART